MLMDVSIIFVNYNTISLLCNAIDSVLAKTKEIDYEIIVVDNASQDNAQQVLQERFNNTIFFLPLLENIGFGRANNEGIKIAEGRNIFLLNPDTILVNNAIKQLSDYLDGHVDVGVAGGNLFNEDGSRQPSFSRYYPSIGFEISNLLHILTLYDRQTFVDTSEPVEVKRVVGAAMMIKKQVIDEVGAFNPRFFMYAEEDELCYRINKVGYKIVHLPQTEIIHLDGRSFQFTEQRQKRRLEGLRTFYKISYSPIYCFGLKVVEYLTILSRLALAQLSKNNENIAYWSFMYKNRKW